MQNRFSENWDGIVRDHQTLLNEKHYRKAGDSTVCIPAKWMYEDFFRRLKSRGENFLFNQLKAEEAYERAHHLAGPRENHGQVLARAERYYMTAMGFKESVEVVTEDLSGGMFGEYRLERANNPRRQRQGRGNKGSEAQYCLRVHRGGSPFGWIIPLIGAEGKSIGYSFHYHEHPHDEGFKFYAFTYGSMKKTLDALKRKFLGPTVESVEVIREYFDIQNPTLERVIAYIKEAVRDHRSDKSDLAYAIDDLEKVGRALEAILRKTKAKGK